MAALQQFQQVSVSQVSPERCHAEGTGLQTAVAGKTVSLTVHMVDQEGKEHHDPVEVNCELVSSYGQTKTKANVQKMEKNKYHISYQPENGGQHQLHIRASDKPILGSPFRILAISPKPSFIIENPDTPAGVAVNGYGDVIVSQWGACNCVSIFKKDSDRARPLYEKKPFSCPSGVAVTERGDILVCDLGNYNIHLFSPEGEELKCVGTEGSGPLQFNGPNFIAVHPQSRKIYITEYLNHRVHVLYSNLAYCTTFGEGDLQFPEGIAIDDDGDRVYVVDSDHDCVKMYAPEGGKPIGELRKNDREHKMRGPIGVAVDSTGVVYVTEAGNDSVSMFDKNGSYIDSFGSTGEKDVEFNNPYGIAISGGKIYIADKDNNRVKVISTP